jgi:hypothetical protein
MLWKTRTINVLTEEVKSVQSHMSGSTGYQEFRDIVLALAADCREM